MNTPAFQATLVFGCAWYRVNNDFTKIVKTWLLTSASTSNSVHEYFNNLGEVGLPGGSSILNLRFCFCFCVFLFVYCILNVWKCLNHIFFCLCVSHLDSDIPIYLRYGKSKFLPGAKMFVFHRELIKFWSPYI